MPIIGFFFSKSQYNGTMLIMNEQISLKKLIDESDLVLIGIGEEFEAGYDFLKDTDIYKSFCRKIERYDEDEKNYRWMYPLMLAKGCGDIKDTENLLAEYNKLAGLISDKDYFVITMNMDPVIFQSDFDNNRIVAPFGNYEKLQCDCNCNNKLYSAEAYIDGVCSLIDDENTAISSIRQEICDDCNGPMVCNTVNASKYNENGYMEQWSKYQDFLMKLVNKKVLLIELGVLDSYPAMIKEAFGRICFYNKKSQLIYCSLSPYYDEKIKDRSFYIAQNARAFLDNLR